MKEEELLEAIAFYALVVMTELEQEGENIVPHLMDDDDNAGQHLRSLLVEYGKTLEGTPYDFLLRGKQIKSGGYKEINELVDISKVKSKD